MNTLASIYTPKFGRIKHPTKALLWNRTATSVLLLLSRLGFVLSCGFIGYLLAAPR
jgi:hypothetical protein